MCDWDKDESKSNWDKTYVATNLRPDANPYDRDYLLAPNSELANTKSDLKPISYAIIVTYNFSSISVGC
jgi:hypothetical protein